MSMHWSIYFVLSLVYFAISYLSWGDPLMVSYIMSIFAGIGSITLAVIALLMSIPDVSKPSRPPHSINKDN